MKSIVSILLLFVLFSAFKCQNQKDVEPSPTLIGKWQMVEYYLSDGGPGYWVNADPFKPSIIEFKANGEYIHYTEDNCSGQYSAAADDEIKIKVSCSTGYVGQSELSGKILTSGELKITPTNPMCIEGCSSKYKRIK